jgi:galactokinase
MPFVLAERASDLFVKCFGTLPACTVVCPGRVNLMGEHTDYNDGFVLPMAIERHLVIAAGRSADRQITLHNVTTGDTASFPLKGNVERGDPPWSNYVRGVVAGFQEKGHPLFGFNAVIDSSLPYGGGLASSAALAVATATLLEQLGKKPLDPVAKALLCQRAEHGFAGVPCGIMDQYTAIFAQPRHALLLDCRTQEPSLVRMGDDSITVLILNTHVRHRLAETEYAQRRRQCEIASRALGVSSLRDVSPEDLERTRHRVEPVGFRRVRHVVTENQRTLKMAAAIRHADWDTAGELMYQSHASLKSDYEVSSPELNVAVEIARSLGKSNGVIGCRMTGAGFGGSVVSLIRTEMLPLVRRRFASLYEQRIGREPELFSTRPAEGVTVLPGTRNCCGRTVRRPDRQWTAKCI